MDVQWNPRRVSAFADEIGEELELQLEVLAANGVGNIELRGVWGKNVLELSAGEVRRVRDAARQAGVGFSAVGSPIGKVPVGGDFAEERERMRRALDFAALLEAPYVRIFSWYIPADAGDGAVARILGEAYAAGFDGFLTLEPHLNVATGSYGRTSPARFKVAADALKGVLAGLGGDDR